VYKIVCPWGGTIIKEKTRGENNQRKKKRRKEEKREGGIGINQ
jgi:hypothetical protein